MKVPLIVNHAHTFFPYSTKNKVIRGVIGVYPIAMKVAFENKILSNQKSK
jgi:hypothetical protein